MSNKASLNFPTKKGQVCISICPFYNDIINVIWYYLTRKIKKGF